MTPEQLAQLFQPFNRLGQEASAEEGTGIGLVVCKRLVELMGGVIGVESTVGKGSVFWIELNLTAAPQAAAHDSRTRRLSRESPVQPDAPLHTLLYVEDNPANLMLVEDLIARRPDIRLLSARDGNRGIEIARASLPDVILMDINLPGISGIEALRILARRPGDGAHPGDRAQRQCDAPRHRERPGGRILPLSHQADQGQRVHGYAGRGAEICANGIGPRSREGTSMMITAVRHSQRQHPDRRRSGVQCQSARATAERGRLHAASPRP